MPHQSGERGSAKILRDRYKVRKFGDADLKMLVEAIDIEGVEIVDFFPRGIPNPDIVHGKLHVTPAAFSKLSDLLVQGKLARIREFRVFPIGIPWPDLLLVDFESVPGFEQG